MMTTPKSPSTPSTTPVPTPAVIPTDSVDTGTNNNVAGILTDETVGARPADGFLLTIALTIAGVLPLAIGIGAARAKAAASRVTACEISFAEETQDHHPNAIRLDRKHGDEQFFAHRFHQALDYYVQLAKDDANPPAPELLYRIALCKEQLGLCNEALEILRQLSQSTDNPALKAVTDYGRARLYLRLNAPGKAATLLRSLELHCEQYPQMPKGLSREVAFMIPLAHAFQTISADSHLPGRDRDQFGDLFVWPLDAALVWADDAKIDDSIVDATRPTNCFDCRVTNSGGLKSVAPSQESTLIDACFPGQSVRSIVEQLANECHWSIDWSDLKNASVIEQKIRYAAENRPVSLVLTTICAEMGATWSLDQNRLVIKRADEDRNRSEQMIVHTLESLINWMPNYRLVNHCRFALAALAEHNGDHSKAAILFSTLVGRDSSPFVIRAAYRAGINYLQTGDYVKASHQLDYVVGGASGHELHSKALLLLGQLKLDRGETQNAIFLFRRATDERYPAQDQARAAAFLGMALYIQEKYQIAAEVILAHRFQFDDSVTRNGAALVTALARWKSLSGDLHEREAPFLYRALVAANSDPDLFGQYFGQTGQLLIGEAYHELGFGDQMAELYTAMRQNDVTEHIQSALCYSLANYEFTNGHTKAASELWTFVAESSSEQLANRSRMRLAELALHESKPEECLSYCAALQPKLGISRKEIQRLQGQAYEQLGKDDLAIRCYAGRRASSLSP